MELLLQWVCELIGQRGVELGDHAVVVGELTLLDVHSFEPAPDPLWRRAGQAVIRSRPRGGSLRPAQDEVSDGRCTVVAVACGMGHGAHHDGCAVTIGEAKDPCPVVAGALAALRQKPLVVGPERKAPAA